jgi:hypothetical protein
VAPIDESRRGPDPSDGRTPARKHRAGFQNSHPIFASPTRWESQLLARRIGHLRAPRALGVARLQAAAGRIIEANPDCSRRASRLVDRLTVAMDLAQAEGRL